MSLIGSSRPPAARNRCLLYPRKPTFSWPSLTSGFDPQETLALLKGVEHWSLTTLQNRLIKIGAKVVRHGRCVTFQFAEVAMPRDLFAEILRRIDGLRPAPVPP